MITDYRLWFAAAICAAFLIVPPEMPLTVVCDLLHLCIPLSSLQAAIAYRGSVAITFGIICFLGWSEGESSQEPKK